MSLEDMLHLVMLHRLHVAPKLRHFLDFNGPCFVFFNNQKLSSTVATKNFRV